MKFKVPLFFTAATLVGGVSASAATLVNYNFGVLTGTRNDWGNLSSAYTAPVAWTGDTRTGNYLLSGSTEATVLSGVSAGNLTAAGTGLVYSTAGLADGDLDLANWVSSATPGQASVSGYITFSLAPTAGQSLNLASISFTGWRNGAGAPDTINFDYSLDGGTTWLDYGSAVVRSTTGAGSVATNVFTQSLDILSGSSVLLRFAPYVTIAGSNTGNWHVTGLSLDGSVSAIPEPSTYGLMGAGALAAVALVRRRRKAV